MFEKKWIQRLALAIVLLMSSIGISGKTDEPHLHTKNSPIIATTNVSVMASGGLNGTASPQGYGPLSGLITPWRTH
jgi:hypothetical protein